MNSIRTMIVVTVLTSVAYGLYVSLNKAPRPAPPEEVAAVGWDDEAPAIELPSEPGPPQVGTAPAETIAEAPPFDAPTYDSAAPTTPGDIAQQGAVPAEAPPFAPPAEVPLSGGTPAEVALEAPPVAAPGSPADYAAPAESPGEQPADFALVMGSIQTLLDQNRLADAQLELSRWYDDPRFSPQQQQQVLALLDQLTGTVLYSNEHYLEQPYEVQPGDTLEAIAARYNVSAALLAKINGIADPMRLQPGTPLKVLQGPFSAYVELSKYRLTLWLNGRYAGRFAIGIGGDQTTPEGEFAILEKLENPTYYGPDGVVAADDPGNPLGERWLDLGNHLGIHGTIDPSSIGRAESRGCIRLAPQEVEDVYDMLIAGSRVLIRR